MNADELAERMFEFCATYRIAKRHWGSLGLLSDMFWTLGLHPVVTISEPRGREMTLADIMEVDPQP